MYCQILIPGLLLPDEIRKTALRDAVLPALSTLLGRGRLQWHPPVAREEWLARAFGLVEAPYAALRLLGEGGQPGTDAWLCADPVQLSITQQGMMLADASTLELEEAETAALMESLNREFADLGQFHAATPGRWYLRLPRPARPGNRRLDEVVGRRVDRFLPEGPDGPAWRRHFNELQVFLHNHPVNEARERAGKPRVNSVWFWGEGSLPLAPAMSTGSAPFGAVLAIDPLARGLALQAGITPSSSGGFALPAAPGNLLVLAEGLARPALYGDLDGWRDALLALDRDWLAPALAALKAGRMDRLEVIALGDRSSLEITLARGELWKFWRGGKSFREMEIRDLVKEETE